MTDTGAKPTDSAVPDSEAKDSAVPDSGMKDSAVADPVVTAPARRVSNTLIAITATLCVGMLVLGGVLIWLLFSTSEKQSSVKAQESGQEAAIAAAMATKSLFSYNHTTIREDMAKALEATTGDFRGEYEEEMNSNVIPQAEENSSSVTATIITQGTVSASKDSATVLVYLNQRSTAKTGTNAVVTPSRLVVDMKRVDGIWKISGLERV